MAPFHPIQPGVASLGTAITLALLTLALAVIAVWLHDRGRDRR